jgi:NTE family protein
MPGMAEGPARVAFVLGGGGHLGAHEVGMLRALLERGVCPDLVVGTSVGALNGAIVAADPSPVAVHTLALMWSELGETGVFRGSLMDRVVTLAKTRTHAHDSEPLRNLLARTFGDRRIEDLTVPFQCVAASIERAAEHWFTSGPLVDALLASCAVPGILPPVRVGVEHFLDGGLVDSIPVGRALELGARTVYVLQVGRIERPLTPPTRPREVALVAFEIARRHRFSQTMASLPPDVDVHVLPTGDPDPGHYGDLSQLRYRDFSRVLARIDQAYAATCTYLSALGARGG